MRKSMCIALAALNLLAGSAHAETESRYFRYRGFTDGDSGIFKPSARLGGWFTGEDKNKDGTLDLSELTAFMTDWGDLKTCYSPGLSCTINSFSFKRTGELQFDIRLSRHYQDMDFILIWESNGLFLDKNLTLSLEYGHYNWTPDTRLFISGIPEPLPVSMLSLGLGLFAFAARKRGHTSHGSQHA